MAMTSIDETAHRDDIEALLPWYATGKLDRSDVARVSAWLERREDGARLVELVREERAEARRAGDALGAPSPGALDRLMTSAAAETRARAQENRPRPRKSGLRLQIWPAVKDFFAAPTPGAVRWTAATAAVALLVQASVIIALLLRSGPRGGEGQSFHLASGGETSGKGMTFLVSFADGATATAITGLLKELNATIVSGPNPGGIYKIVVQTKAEGGKGGRRERDYAPHFRPEGHRKACITRRKLRRKNAPRFLAPGAKVEAGV